MPIVGFLISRVDARYLIATGFLIVAFALTQMTNLTLGIDYRTATLWRAYQAAGLAFLFVPINTISFTDMPPEASNQVSGLMNLMRNLGGSIGISAVTTSIARRQQVHQAYLARNTFEFNPHLQQTLAEMTSRFSARFGPAEATRRAYGEIYASVQSQAAVLAYIDTFWIMATVCILAIGLLFLAKRPSQAREQWLTKRRR
jgi:DHA2 family multidrug resistance protein